MIMGSPEVHTTLQEEVALVVIAVCSVESVGLDDDGNTSPFTLWFLLS